MFFIPLVNGTLFFHKHNESNGLLVQLVGFSAAVQRKKGYAKVVRQIGLKPLIPALSVTPGLSQGQFNLVLHGLQPNSPPVFLIL